MLNETGGDQNRRKNGKWRSIQIESLKGSDDHVAAVVTDRGVLTAAKSEEIREIKRLTAYSFSPGNQCSNQVRGARRASSEK